MSLPSGRRIAVDVGTVRNGLAISDAIGLTANPVGSFTELGLLEKIREISNEEALGAIYIGLPLHLSGIEGESARLARALARQVAALGVAEVYFVDERLTSKSAESTARAVRDFDIDAFAAAEILSFALQGEKKLGTRFGSKWDGD